MTCLPHLRPLEPGPEVAELLVVEDPSRCGDELGLLVRGVVLDLLLQALEPAPPLAPLHRAAGIELLEVPADRGVPLPGVGDQVPRLPPLEKRVEELLFGRHVPEELLLHGREDRAEFVVALLPEAHLELGDRSVGLPVVLPDVLDDRQLRYLLRCHAVAPCPARAGTPSTARSRVNRFGTSGPGMTGPAGAGCAGWNEMQCREVRFCETCGRRESRRAVETGTRRLSFSRRGWSDGRCPLPFPGIVVAADGACVPLLFYRVEGS